jgi:hypothetical protein
VRNHILMLAPIGVAGSAVGPMGRAPKRPGIEDGTVYRESGRYGGWPANQGIWAWGDEILVGFSAGCHKLFDPERHPIDRERPEEHLLARSLDGGRTWLVEKHPELVAPPRPGHMAGVPPSPSAWSPDASERPTSAF